MSVLTESFLKADAHFVPSEAEVIHLANSAVLVQFNFHLFQRNKKKMKNQYQQSERPVEEGNTSQSSEVSWKQSRGIQKCTCTIWRGRCFCCSNPFVLEIAPFVFFSVHSGLMHRELSDTRGKKTKKKMCFWKAQQLGVSATVLPVTQSIARTITDVYVLGFVLL